MDTVDAGRDASAWRAWVHVTSQARVSASTVMYVLDAGRVGDGRWFEGGPKVVRLVAGGSGRAADEAWWLSVGRELTRESRLTSLAVSADERYAFLLDAGARSVVVVDLVSRSAHAALRGRLPVDASGRATLSLSQDGDWLIGELPTQRADRGGRVVRWRVPVSALVEARWPELARLHYLEQSAAISTPGPGRALPKVRVSPSGVKNTTATNRSGEAFERAFDASVNSTDPSTLTPSTTQVDTSLGEMPQARPWPVSQRRGATRDISRSDAFPPALDADSLRELERSASMLLSGLDAPTVASTVVGVAATPTPSVPRGDALQGEEHPPVFGDSSRRPTSTAEQDSLRATTPAEDRASSMVNTPSTSTSPVLTPGSSEIATTRVDPSPPRPVEMRTEDAVAGGVFEAWTRARLLPDEREPARWRGDDNSVLRRHRADDEARAARDERVAQQSQTRWIDEPNPYLLPAAARWARVGWYRLSDAPPELTTLAEESARLYSDTAAEHGRGD